VFLSKDLLAEQGCSTSIRGEHPWPENWHHLNTHDSRPEGSEGPEAMPHKAPLLAAMVTLLYITMKPPIISQA